MADESRVIARVDASPGHAVWRRLGRHRLAVAGGAIVLVVTALAAVLPP